MFTPVSHVYSGYYNMLNKDQQEMIDRMINTENIKINWKQMEFVIYHLYNIGDIEMVQDDSFISFPMLHVLKKTNVTLKDMVIIASS